MLRIPDNRSHRPPGCCRPDYHFVQPECRAGDRASQRRSSVQVTDEMTIGEVSVVTGVSTSAIRYYERRGLVEPPQRQGGKRRFETAVVHRLSLIIRARQVGFSLEEIKLLIDDTDRSWPRLVDELRERSDRLAVMMGLLEEARRCGCKVLELCPLIEPIAAESDPGC